MRANEHWSMDFMTDQLFNGQQFRILTLVDNFSRESLAIQVGQRLSGDDVVRTLEHVTQQRGVPKSIRVDNGKLCKPGGGYPRMPSVALDVVRFLIQGDLVMRLMTIDLGKFRSVACLYNGDDDVTFRTIETRPQSIHELLVAWPPERLVIEVGTVAGWVHDLAQVWGSRCR